MFNIKWDNDKDHSNCYNCSSRFTIILRKHHCRKCGKIFCIKCLKNCKIFNVSHLVCSNCFNILNELVFIDKTELYYFNIELKNLRDFFKKYIKNKKNVSTQTHINTNSIYIQTNNVSTLENTTQTNNNEFKSKSLDIINCINNASKITKSNNYVAEKEILKYQECKNNQKEQELEQKEQELEQKEQELEQKEQELEQKEQELEQKELKQKQEADALRKKQEVDNVLRKKQEVDNVLRKKQEADDLRKKQEADDLRKKQEVDDLRKKQEADDLRKKQNDDALKRKKEVESYKNIKMSTRDIVLKRKMDKKIQEEKNYKNELENIHKNYKNEVENAKNYKY